MDSAGKYLMDKRIEDFIESESVRLAREYRIREVDRIRAVVRQTAKRLLGDMVNTPEQAEEALEHGPWYGSFVGSILKHLSPRETLKLFEDEDPMDLYYVENFLISNCEWEPMHTYQELACLFKDFIRYLENNRDSLLATGYPLQVFCPSHWLFKRLSTLYPVKIPYSIKVPEESSEEGYQLLYTWRKEKRRLRGAPNYAECSYKEAPFVESFSNVEIVESEEARAGVFELKVAILEILCESLATGKNLKLWDKCIKALTSKLSRREFHALNEIEEKFSKLDKVHKRSFAIIADRAVDLTSSVLKTGGIKDMLEIIEFVEQDLEIGKMNSTKRKLLAINENKKISSYYDLLPKARISELIDITNEFHSYGEEEEKNFKKVFNGRLERDISRHFRVPLLVRPEYYDTTKAYAHYLEQRGNKNIDVLYPYTQRIPQKKGVTPIQLPLDTNWEDITIKFKDGYNVNIKVKDLKIDADYKQMGFEDTRNRLPNKQWDLLRLLALQKGELAWDKPGANRYVKKKKQLLSDTLKAYFQIEKDPFLPYKPQKAYKIRINLIPD